MSTSPDKSTSLKMYDADENLSYAVQYQERLPVYFVDTHFVIMLCDRTFYHVKEPFCALIYWEQYLNIGDRQLREIFLEQANWLVQHEVGIGEDAGGWPMTVSHPTVFTTGSWLSSLVQGISLSVLVRAY